MLKPQVPSKDDRVISAPILLLHQDQDGTSCQGGPRSREVETWSPGQLAEDEAREVPEGGGLQGNLCNDRQSL